MPIATKKLFATIASSMMLATSALAPTPALAQTGGGSSGGGSYCTCQGSHLGGCLPEESGTCGEYCEQYRYQIVAPPPPECYSYFNYYPYGQEPAEHPSDETAEPAGQ